MYPDISICICIKYTFCVFCYGSFELGNYLFTRNASASLLDNIELVKVSPFGGSTAGELWEGRMPSCGRGWCEPILVGGLIYIGRHRDLYSFVVGPI